MSWFMVDVEADGPCPGIFSMVELGVVRIDRGAITNPPGCSFYGKLRPMTDTYQEAALSAVGITRERTMGYDAPAAVMKDFREWISAHNVPGTRPMFMSDNNGFDWQFVNFYLWTFVGENPFGWSSTNLGSLYKGMMKEFYTSFKKHRRTEHDHNPVHDCLGNIEALYYMIDEHGMSGITK